MIDSRFQGFGPPPRAAALAAMALWTIVAAGALAAPPAAVRKVAPAVRDSLVAAIETERAKTETWLKSEPTSYLAAVRRVDFDDRPRLSVGRDPGNDLRLDDPSLAARHLVVTVIGDSFRVEAQDEGATFAVRGTPTRQATLAPGSVGLGRFVLRLSHQRYPALIVFDPQSPRFAEFKGLEFFPPDLAYRFELPLVLNPRPDTVTILSTRGNQRRAVRAGWFEFKVGGRACRLEATRLLEPGIGENDVGLFFKDATNGKETYGLGRYLDPERLPDGRYLLDFNHAYNPACAFSEHYNCPIPPKANALKVAIRAGEKDSHYLKH